MPELPEVETVRRGLAPRVVGRRVVAFDVQRGASRLLVGARQTDVRRRLVGCRIASLGRRGKYLLFGLDDGSTLVVHLRMTGSLRHRRTGAPEEPYLRARIGLDDGRELRFIDVRKFGTLQLFDDVETAVGKLGPEPLSPAFSVEALWERLRGRRTPVKSALLNQANIAGLGNIYADEALFLARLHPEAPAGALRPAEQRALHAAINEVVREGIMHRGASFRDYSDAGGHEGRQQYFVRVFRRTDEPCDGCGTAIRRTVVGQRASHWCPQCQPARQASRKVRRGRR